MKMRSSKRLRRI
jgi:hypothetical protein